MGSLALILPEAVVLLAAVVALFLGGPEDRGSRAAAWLGAGACTLAAFAAWWVGTGRVRPFGTMLTVDTVAQFSRIATLLLAAVFLVWLAGKGMGAAGRVREASALALLSVLGCMLLSSATDYVVMFLALETATMPAYVLAGFDKGDERGLEGAMKYFLLSMVTSLVLLYGVSLVIGLTGSTAISVDGMGLQGAIPALAGAFVLAGLLAKVSAAPFHYWTPDAYAGAPVASVAFISAVPKVAGVVAVVRVAEVFAVPVPGLAAALGALAVLSMLLGNLAAYPQRDLRRLMAYSGVAHAGYLLIGVATGTVAGGRAAVVYALMYAVPSMGVMFVAADAGTRLEDVAGLARRRPALAWAAVVFLVSLVGVPPLAGFFGKLYLFGAALDEGLTYLVVAGVVTSALSAGYYFRVVKAAFLEEGAAVTPLDPERTHAADVGVWLCFAATFALGVAAGPLLASVGLTLP